MKLHEIPENDSINNVLKCKSVAIKWDGDNKVHKYASIKNNDCLMCKDCCRNNNCSCYDYKFKPADFKRDDWEVVKPKMEWYYHRFLGESCSYGRRVCKIVSQQCWNNLVTVGEICEDAVAISVDQEWTGEVPE